LSACSAQTNSNFFIGVEFTTTQSIQVTHLGVFDANDSDTLGVDTGVGIYSVPENTPKTGTHVASAIVPSGTVEQESGFRDAFYTQLATPVILPAGRYIVAAEAGLGTREPFCGGFGGTYLAGAGITNVNSWFGGSNFPGVGNNHTFTNSGSPGSWASGTFLGSVITP
jgi:hypothetical protein